MEIRVVVSLTVALMVLSSANAQDQPGLEVAVGEEACAETPCASAWPHLDLDWSMAEGFTCQNPEMKPAKADFLYRRQADANEYNYFWWNQCFKGGFGTVDYDGRGDVFYGGGHLRPLVARPELGELILGTLAVQSPTSTDYELQAEYRFTSGIGFGGGMAERSGSAEDVSFGKVTYRNEWNQWRYILELQEQLYGASTSVGGYAALYTESIMGVYGNDGEQWRATLGFIAPDTSSGKFRPAAEVLYEDDSIGAYNGPRILFINVTMGYSGGFLSNPSRLGRAMGPQGLEFGNPFGFLRPTWNRRINTWEIGGLVDFRATRTESPTGLIDQKYELLLFPFDFDYCGNVLDGVFTGPFWRSTGPVRTMGATVGLKRKIGFLDAGLALEHEFETGVTIVTIGLIDKF